MERQPQVNSLQEISDSLLIKGHGEDYIEAEEKVHVIEKKLRRLLEQVSHDLMSLQGSQVSPRVAFKYKAVITDASRKAASSPWEWRRVIPLSSRVALEHYISLLSCFIVCSIRGM